MLASIDFLGQEPSLKCLYTQISFCYSVTDESLYPIIVERLTKGLEQLSLHFPWVAGKVEDSKIKPFKHIPTLIIKDLRQNTSIPTMTEYKQAKFPVRMFDETIFAPCNALSIADFKDKDAPVFLVQVNFIQGGLILTFNGNHQAMDMIGQGEIMSLLSKACHQQSFTEEDILIGNLDRQHITPLLNEDELKKMNVQHQMKTPSTSSSSSSSPQPSCHWANFIFDKHSLGQLKSISSKQLLDHIDFISTDDALSAFIWQSVTKARLPRLQQQLKENELSTKTTTFSRSINVRKYLNIPATYLGNIQNMTYNRLTLKELTSSSNQGKDLPLGHIASQLRSAVHPKISDLGQRTRILVTLLATSKDKNAISVTAALDPSSDIMVSSWAKVNCYSLDFNLGLGLPESVTRPLSIPVESMIYLLPKSLKGDIVASICLRDDDMERLKNDPQFTKFAQYIG